MTKVILALLAISCAAMPAFAGGVDVVSLLDTQGHADPSLLIGATDEQKAQYLTEGKLDSQILAFYVNGILFDAGLRDGRIVDELAKNGIKAGDVKTILITHLHPDHFGGLVDSEGKASFPNAEVYVSRIERAYWNSSENVINSLKLYNVHEFEFGDEVVSGVKAIDAAGHTPGHTVFEVNNDGEKLLIVGDIVHFVQIQFPVPEISVRYDVDPDKARESRKKILDYAAENEIPIAGMHITPPGTCKIKKSESGYTKY